MLEIYVISKGDVTRICLSQEFLTLLLYVLTGLNCQVCFLVVTGWLDLFSQEVSCHIYIYVIQLLLMNVVWTCKRNINSYPAGEDFYYFTPANARWFYSSKGSCRLVSAKLCLGASVRFRVRQAHFLPAKNRFLPEKFWVTGILYR